MARVDFVWSTTKGWSSVEPLYRKAVEKGWNTDLIKIKKHSFLPDRYKDIADTVVIAYDGPLRRLKKHGWNGKFIYVEHGLSPVKYWSYKYDFFYDAEILFYPGRIFKDKMNAINPGYKKGLLGGLPKCDDLYNVKIDRKKMISDLGLDYSKPVILFAPSWGAKYGGGIKNIRYIKGIENCITIPHPSEYKLAKKYKAVIPEVKGNINRYLHLADIVISDVSSVAAEAALIGKCTIQLELDFYPGCYPAFEKRESGIWLSHDVEEREINKTDRKLRPFKIPFLDRDWCFAYSCKPRELEQCIKKALEEPYKYKERSEKLAEESCYGFDGEIRQRMLDMIEVYMKKNKLLQL